MQITTADLDNIRSILYEVREFGLEAEIFAWSLKYMNENPLLTIEEAVMMAYDEWVK